MGLEDEWMDGLMKHVFGLLGKAGVPRVSLQMYREHMQTVHRRVPVGI